MSKQLDIWFDQFDRIAIAAHLRPGTPPLDHRRLRNQNIAFTSLRQAGGVGTRAKVDVMRAAGNWVRLLIPMIRSSTAVHLRSPCNVTLVAIPLARLLNSRRYAIYADNWNLRGVEPVSYRLQRWMLHHFAGPVHAYASPDSELPRGVRPNLSPVFTEAEVAALSPRVETRIRALRTDPISERPTRICCAGTLSNRKNQAELIRAVDLLKARGIDVHLRIAGTGPAGPSLRAMADELALHDRVQFEGHLGREQLEELYVWADINILPSLAEGFGKVILEGMAVGCPVICGPGPVQANLAGAGRRGLQADPPDATTLAEQILLLRDLGDAERICLIRNCQAHVSELTLERFGQEVRDIVHGTWGIDVRP